jgi:GR25 family glycosyltransferase involved in LPS biosynthesis
MVNLNNKIKYQQIINGYATSLYPGDGKKKTRIELQEDVDYKTKIAAKTCFVNSIFHLDTLFSKITGRDRKWVKIDVEGFVSIKNYFINFIQKIVHFIKTRRWPTFPPTREQKTILVNVNSLCKRTALTKSQVLSASPEELSKLLANPASITWNYSKLSNQLFPHILFINMKTRPDREESFKKHLAAIGADLNYEVVDAVIGQDLPADEIEKMSKSSFAVRTSKDDRKGRLGCFKSHLKALKHAQANNWPQVLITEDDVRFIPNYFTSSYAEQAKQELPSDWGMLFLGHYDADPAKAKDFSDHLVQPGLPYDCHAYVVNASMYDSLITALENELNKGEGLMRALDVVIAEDLVQTRRIYACKDNIAIQNSGMSSILSKFILGNYTKELRTFHRTLTPRSANAPFTADGLPIMKPLLAGTLYQMMYHTAEIFDKHKIQYVIEGGTMLGAERHKGLIPHDDDIDLLLMPGEENKLLKLDVLKDLMRTGLTVSSHWLGAKIYPKKDHPLGYSLNKDGYRYKTPSIDLFFSEKTQKEGESAIVYKNLRARNLWPKMYIKESEMYNSNGSLNKVDFGPLKVRSIANQKSYCTRAYGANYMHEGYLQYDHLKEWSLTKKPIVLTDFAPPSFTYWEGLPPIPTKKSI